MICIIRIVIAVLLFGSLQTIALSAPQHRDRRQSANPATPEQSPPSPVLGQMEKRQAREANKQRQTELKRDTDRLLQLATELKLEVDKSNENTLSLNVLKRAEEIEKLAHSVRQKMKGY